MHGQTGTPPGAWLQAVRPYPSNSGALAGAPRSAGAKLRFAKPRLRPPRSGGGRLAMNAHRADHLVRHAGDAGHRDQQRATFVDRVAIVAREHTLLVAEHRAPQRVRITHLPRFARRLDPVFANDVVFERQVEQHRASSVLVTGERRTCAALAAT